MEKSKFILFSSLLKEARTRINGLLEGLKKSRIFGRLISLCGVDSELYRLSLNEILLPLAVGYCVAVLLLWLFYRSLWVCLPAVFFAIGYTVASALRKKTKKKMALRSSFIDLLSGFGSALEAGESPENALNSCLADMSLMYRPSDPIVKELKEMVRKLYTNQTLEEAMYSFAERTGDEDIQRFAEVFSISKRSGGRLCSVIRSANRTMNEKDEVLREIDTLISEKRLEASIMAFMPPGIIAYFLLMDSEFIAPLYSGIAGRTVMTIMLLAYLGSLAIMLRITNIQV